MRALLHMVLPLLLLCVLFSVLIGCAAKGTVQEAPLQSIEKTPLSEDAAIANFIGNAHEGATQYFTQSSYGAVTVTAGREYLSALGLLCREAYIRGGTQTRTSACKDPEQGWSMAPDVLGEGNR
mgnify:CR=1 FL=1